MQRRDLWVIVVLIVSSLSMAACGAALRANPDAQQANSPATIERIDGTDLNRLKLSAKSVDRLGIKTAQVREAQVAGPGGTAQRKIVPYAAVLYDSNNRTWVYTTAQPLTYVRHRITVDHIDKSDAVLTDGPAAGTTVVTVGAAELFATEFKSR